MDNRAIKTNDIINSFFQSVNNWIILGPDGLPKSWEDGTSPKVYSCLEDLMVDFDKKAGDTIITEYSYIMKALREFEDYDDYITNFWY